MCIFEGGHAVLMDLQANWSPSNAFSGWFWRGEGLSKKSGRCLCTRGGGRLREQARMRRESRRGASTGVLIWVWATGRGT